MENSAKQAHQKQLLEKAKKNIAKIEKTQDKFNAPSASVPRSIDSLHVESIGGGKGQSLSARELSYQEELACRLKLLLRLPEYGEVKIKLTLERSGHFIEAVVISAESMINRKYIEKTVPSLKYPGFGSCFENASRQTFVIILSND